MVRVTQGRNQGALLLAAVAIGLASSWLLLPRSAAGATPQDPATTMQLQQLAQAVNNLQLQVTNRLDLMQVKIDTLERTLQELSYRMQNAESAHLGQPLPTRAEPLPGIPTFGRLVSETTETGELIVQDAAGHMLARIGRTAEGPGLLIYDIEGNIDAALVSTTSGAEIRMRDENGALRTVLSLR